MSTFNPTSFHFNYKRYVYQPIQAFIQIDLTNSKLPEFPFSGARVESALPPWLEVYNLSFSNSPRSISFNLRLKENYIKSMSEGYYDTKIDFKVKYAALGWLLDVYDYPISLQVINTVLLNVNPSNLLFNYTVGSSLPTNKIVQIVAESNWSVSTSQSWVTLSSSNGIGNSQLVAGVDPASLTVGTYDAVVMIQDGISQKNIVVTLVVSEGDTPSTFLYVNPRNLEFVSEFEKDNPKEFNLNLETSHDWSASVSESWISLSASSGNSGIQNILVGVSSIALTKGVYTGFVEFTSNNLIKKTYITLRVVEFLETGIESETLYFANDRNKLKVTNVEDNTFLVLDFITSTQSNNLSYQKEVPFYQGVASVLIGDETSDLLRSSKPTNIFTSRIFNTIQPLNISFASSIENKKTGAITPLKQYSNVRFLNGSSPTDDNKLSYIPSIIYMTNQGVISLSILSYSLPEPLEITGDATAIFHAAIASDLYVYNAVINLASLNLTKGNTIAIKFGELTTNVIIKEPAVESTLLAFENEWNQYEFFECTGFLKKQIDVKKRTTTSQVEDKKHTKISSLEIGYRYSINTGNIYTQEENEWLSKILTSKKVFIYLNGNAIEILIVNKNLEFYKTRERIKSYTLDFKKAII